MTSTVVLDDKTYFVVPIKIEYINLDLLDGKFKNLLIFEIHRDLYEIINTDDFIFFNTNDKEYHLFNDYQTKEEPIGYSARSNEYVVVIDFVSNHHEYVTSRVKTYFRKEKIKNILE